VLAIFVQCPIHCDTGGGLRHLRAFAADSGLPTADCDLTVLTVDCAIAEGRCRTPVGQMIIFGKDPAGGNKLVS
jgi:hypothetical protein